MFLQISVFDAIQHRGQSAERTTLRCGRLNSELIAQVQRGFGGKQFRVCGCSCDPRHPRQPRQSFSFLVHGSPPRHFGLEPLESHGPLTQVLEQYLAPAQPRQNPIVFSLCFLGGNAPPSGPAGAYVLMPVQNVCNTVLATVMPNALAAANNLHCPLHALFPR